MNYADILKSLRLEAEMTQKELAEKLQIGQSTIVGYERNEREPTVTNLKKYADYFNVSMDYLSGRTDDLGFLVTNSGENIFFTSPHEQRLVVAFRKLTPASQNIVITLVNNMASMPA